MRKTAQGLGAMPTSSGMHLLARVAADVTVPASTGDRHRAGGDTGAAAAGGGAFALTEIWELQDLSI